MQVFSMYVLQLLLVPIFVKLCERGSTTSWNRNVKNVCKSCTCKTQKFLFSLSLIQNISWSYCLHPLQVFWNRYTIRIIKTDHVILHFFSDSNRDIRRIHRTSSLSKTKIFVILCYFAAHKSFFKKKLPFVRNFQSSLASGYTLTLMVEGNNILKA